MSPERTVVSRAKKLDMIAEALRGHADCLEVTAIPHARQGIVNIRKGSTPLSPHNKGIISFSNKLNYEFFLQIAFRSVSISCCF